MESKTSMVASSGVSPPPPKSIYPPAGTLTTMGGYSNDPLVLLICKKEGQDIRTMSSGKLVEVSSKNLL